MINKLMFRTYLINNMSDKFKKKLSTLSFGENGMMEELLWFFNCNNDKKGYALCAYDDSKLIGWVLYSNYIGSMYCGYTETKKVVLHIFVDPNHRNLGIGKKLMFQADKKIKNRQVVVFPHDEKSNKLFDYCCSFMSLIKD